MPSRHKNHRGGRNAGKTPSNRRNARAYWPVTAFMQSPHIAPEFSAYTGHRQHQLDPSPIHYTTPQSGVPALINFGGPQPSNYPYQHSMGGGLPHQAGFQQMAPSYYHPPGYLPLHQHSNGEPAYGSQAASYEHTIRDPSTNEPLGGRQGYNAPLLQPQPLRSDLLQPTEDQTVQPSVRPRDCVQVSVSSSNLRGDAPEFVPGRSLGSHTTNASLSEDKVGHENKVPAEEVTPRLKPPARKPPPAAWGRPRKPREAWTQWKLDDSQIRRGLIAFLKPNDTWHGNHPAIIRSVDARGNISVWTGTSFGESGGTIWSKFKDIRKPEVHREHCHEYLLIDDGKTKTHYGLPVLQLENGEKLPKTTYVSFIMGAVTVRKEDLARWSHDKKFANFHVTAASMDAAESYFRWFNQWRADRTRAREEAARRALLAAQSATFRSQHYQNWPGSRQH